MNTADGKKFSLHRLEGLTDGIYAIAMTLLALSLPLPHVEGVSGSSDIMAHFQSYADLFGVYALSFMVLGNFWVIQLKIFKYIKASNIPHIWTNLGGLLFVCLIPFSSSMMGLHNHTFFANLVFHLNIFLISIFFVLQCRVLLHFPETVLDEFDETAIRRITRINAILPLVSLAGVFVALFYPDWSALVYLGVPFLTNMMKSGRKPLRRRRQPLQSV